MAEVRPAEEERVHAIVDGGRAANVFTSLSAVPLIGGVCDVAKKILDDVREYEGNAEDAAEAGRCVLDVLDFLLVLTRREDALPEKREDKVREAMEDLELLLGDFKAAVQEFGTRGFFKRAWNLRKYNVGTLSRIDGMIRDKLDFLANLYGLARDARVVQHSPRVMPYKLEAVLLKYVDERHDSDEKALQDAATVGGVHPEETRAALAALDYSQDQSPPLLEEKNYSRLKELIFLLKRAVERGDAAAVRLAGKTVSEVMAKTCLLTIYRKCLVVQLLAASFADDAKTIGALLERAPEIIHEMLSDVGGAALALSALHISAMRGNIDAVKKLKNMNGDFTIPDACKRTPLHHAAARGHAKVISYFLLHCGVDVNAKDRDDWTALMCASHEGFLNVVERLVEIGYADVNSGYDGDDGDETAIDLALCRGHTDIVNYLDEHGARRLSHPFSFNSDGSMITLTFSRELVRISVGRTSSLRLQLPLAGLLGADDEKTAHVGVSNGGEISARHLDSPSVKEIDSAVSGDVLRSASSTVDGAVGTGFPTKHYLPFGIGKLYPGYLVSLPTTGRPIFEVVDFIAEGGYAEIYVVRSMTHIATLHAMRRVRFDALRGGTSGTKKKKIIEEIRLFREILLLAELGAHPHIVSLHYFVTSNTAEYLLFTTLIDGARVLGRLVSSGDLYDGDTSAVRVSISSLLQQLGSAIAFCHSCGVLHQDVTLNNVLVDSKGRAYLGGFGNARRGNGVDAQLRAPLEGCTRAYASPEVIAALDMSSRRTRDVPIVSPAETDIWAYGVVALHLYRADEETIPAIDVNKILESTVVLKPPDASWTQIDVKTWLRKNSLSIPSNTLDGASLFELLPNNLCDGLPWIKKKRDRVRLRRMLLAPPPAMSTLMQQCLAPDVNGRPTCGEALLEAIELPIAAVSCAAAETDDAAQKLLNIGRAVVELNDVELACRVCRALEATGANSSDMADCYALVACAHLRSGDNEEATKASDRAIEHDPAHGGALFIKAEATHRRDPSLSGSLFVDVVCQARLYDAKLFALPCTLEKDSVAYLKVTKDEADSARDLVTNDRVSVSKCVRELPPSVVIRSDVKTADSRLEPSPLRIMAGSVPHRIRAALTNVVCSSESVEAAMRTGRVVVEGAAGSGKGWTLRALVVALCENQLDDADSNASQLVFPLTISLASIEDPESDWLGRAIDDAQDHCEVLRLARVERRLVLCLDGLNEITPLTRQSIVKKIVKYSRSCLLTVVTSRPMAGNVDEFAPHGFSFLNIAQVNPKHLEALGLPKKISSLVETPLAFRLALLALFPGGGSTATPQAVPAIHSCFDILRIADKEFMARSMKLAQQDGTLAVARDVLCDCDPVEVRGVFERLALMAHVDRRVLLQRADFEYLNSPRVAAAIWSLARSGLLPPLAPRGDSAVAFFNLTFQEYYAASILGPDSLLDDAFDFGDPWWELPALFAFQLADPHVRNRVLEALASKIPKIRVGETVEVKAKEKNAYFPRVVVAPLDSNGKIGVDHRGSPTELVSVQRVRRDVASVAALARRAAAEGVTALVAGLLDHGADLITPVDSNTKDSALHAAARFGRSECARVLVRAGARPFSLNRFGSTPLYLGTSKAVAVYYRAEMVRVFEPPKCDAELAAHPLFSQVITWLDSENESFDTIPDNEWDDDARLYAFAQVCDRRRTRAAAALAASIDSPNSCFGGGVSMPLHFAIVNSCSCALSILLERGARLDDGAGKTALELASRFNCIDALSLIVQNIEDGDDFLADALFPCARFGFVECAKILIAKKADVNKARAKNDGSTPLHFASWNGHVECVGLLIEAGAEVDKARTDVGATPLHVASQNGHVECARQLIDNGADVNKQLAKNGLSPLFVACTAGYVECARLLIANGAYVDKFSADGGWTPLHQSCRKGRVECVHLLIEMGAEIDKAWTKDGVTPLHVASKHGFVDCVRVLITNGAEVDKALASDGSTPLHMASHNGHLECARLLIEKGAKVAKTLTINGSTSLHLASENGRVECVQLLMENDATTVDKARTNDGATSLHVASKNGHVECVRVLIENGATVDKELTSDGSTSLRLASENGHAECARLLIARGAKVNKARPVDASSPLHMASHNGHFECAKLLIEEGAKIDEVLIVDGSTPLHLASESGHIECVQLLIENGATVDKARVDDGATPLHLASESDDRVEIVRLLVAKGADVNKKLTDDGSTPLRLASDNGHVECVKLLISMGAGIDKASTDDGSTPLHMACHNDHAECARLLIEAGADIDKNLTTDGSSPLHLAAENGNAACVQLLVEKGTKAVDARTNNGLTPLRLASENGYCECARLLISKGAEVDKIAIDDGSTPLHAASRNGHVECARLLIAHGARITKTRTGDGSTALHLASENGQVEGARLLIDAGADVASARTKDGATPLHLASENGHMECVQLLIEKGTEADGGRLSDGATPLHMASHNDHVECVQLLIDMGVETDKPRLSDGATPLHVASESGHVECMQLLIAEGAKANKARTTDGATPLHMAAQNGHVECVRLLIAHGAVVDLSSTDGGVTALHMAALNGHLDCARLLIEKGAEVDKARTDDGGTPLHMASQNGNVECARVLIGEGAKVDTPRSNDGWAPLHLAANNGHVECVRFLVGAGADVRAKTHQRRTPRDVAISRDVQKTLSEAEATSRAGSCLCVSKSSSKAFKVSYW